MWSSTLSKISSKRVNLTLCSFIELYFATFFSLHQKLSTCRNNTNLFTRLDDVGYWRVEISRNHTKRKKTGELHQVGHDL